MKFIDNDQFVKQNRQNYPLSYFEMTKHTLTEKIKR